ncbi:MAG: DUF3794 domain-containing protein, partial [Clostridiales bacterium]|nr:DUF3794 domain-containing protein [Clostridiales bacterium]
MKFDRQLLRMSRDKGRAFTQLTLEDDFIIPDVKPDVMKVIYTKGALVFDAPKISNHSLWVNGRMNFTVLYRSEDSQWKIEAASGSVPFQEKLAIDELEETDEVELKGALEDISASLINSRKIAVRAVADVKAAARDYRWEEVVTGIEGDRTQEDSFGDGESTGKIEEPGYGMSQQNHPEYECRFTEKELMNLKFSQKELIRDHRDVEISQGKPNILDLVYYDVSFTGVRAIAQNRAIALAGEAYICIFYKGQGEEDIQVFNTVVPLDGIIESKDLASDDICWIKVEPEETQIEVRQDYDGEQRVLAADMAFAITAFAWEERKVPVLEDVYSLSSELVVSYQPVRCERMLICNHTKVKLAEQLQLDAGSERMLSICSADAQVTIEHISKKENGLMAEGMLTLHLLYLTSDDFQPVGYAKGFLPIEQLIEIPQAAGEIRYELCSEVEQLAVGLMDSSTYEVKATVTLDVMVFEAVSFENI